MIPQWTSLTARTSCGPLKKPDARAVCVLYDGRDLARTPVCELVLKDQPIGGAKGAKEHGGNPLIRLRKAKV